jgi:chromatin remodeling complex protein RSC6
MVGRDALPAPEPAPAVISICHVGSIASLKCGIVVKSALKIKSIMAINSALSKPLNLSPELEEVVGAGPMPRTEVVKQLWVYIKKHDLQNPQNKRNILADDKLKAIFGGKGEVTMFEMTKLVSAHLK